MTKVLGTAAIALLAMSPAMGAPVLSVTATDNGTALVFTPNTNVPGDLTGSFADASFSQITVDLSGVPAVPSPDFGTVTLQVSGFTGTGTHVIDLIAQQSGLTEPAGFNGMLTQTNNNLIGGPGPVTQNFSINGSLLDTHTFPASPPTAADMVFINPNLPAITSETQEFVATFTATQQNLEATQEFQAQVVGVSEPSSLAILGLGLIGTGWAVRRRRQHHRHEAVTIPA